MAAYQVLARKWRPKTFTDLVGQQHVIKALQNALDKGRLHHAYLLTGTRGVGKTTIARILAKSLNCENSNHGDPCGVCQSCRDIDAGRFVDLLEIDAASNTGIDNIREVLENAQYVPTAGKYKVYIIDEVHMLSKSAFNAMLKTLEEPPEHVKFILATTDPHKVPITVLSRCLQFVLRNLTLQQINAHLIDILKTEQIIYEPTAITLLAKAANGSMRDALSLLDQAIAMGSGSVQERDVREMIGAVDKTYLYELLTFLMEQNGEALINKAQDMASNAIGFDSALNELAMLLQQIALLKNVPSAISTDDSEYENLLQLTHYFSDEQIQLYYQCVIHGKKDLPLAPDEYAGFVMTLLRMLAFAPFAAKNVPYHATIEGTQFHSPIEDDKAKKTLLPENPVRQPVSGSIDNHVSEKQPDNTNIQTNSQKNGLSPQKQFQPQDLPPPHPTEIKRHYIPYTNLAHNNSITPTKDNQLIESHNYQQNKIPNTVSEQLSVAQPESTNHESEEFEDIPPQQITQTENNETPTPELSRENWIAITQQINSKIAAGQMILNHLAWVNWSGGILELALMQDKTRSTVKKEYFKRISDALSDIYKTPIEIKIRPWQDGMGWETPAQYRERMAQNKYDLAYDALLADPTVQTIMTVFDAQLVPETIQLK